MKPLAFSKSGKFWRGNLHTHSNHSDGLLSPDDLCQQYKDEGYNFLVISDHFVGLYNYPITEPQIFLLQIL
jgi:histidinol phosphatase-like PHP family hydrolase